MTPKRPRGPQPARQIDYRYPRAANADNEYAMIDSTIVRAHSAQRRRSKKTAKTRLGCALRHKPKPEPKRDYRGER
jgi:hypothetical protein